MNPVRIAVIGAGLIGKKHIDYIAACPNAELVAVADPDPSIQFLAAQHGARWWTDIAPMLGAGGIDGAIVATPTALHEQAGLHCIEAGIPALIEKPICHNIDAAERLNSAAEAAGVQLLIGHHRRYNPWLAAAKKMIERGDLGRPVGLSAIFACAKPTAYFNADWRRAPGGGPVLTNFVHDLDLMRSMLGEIAEVGALTSSITRGFQTEDTAVITLRFQNGALGTMFCSDTAPSPWTWEQSTGENHPTFPESGENAYRIFGTEASMEFPRLRVWRHDGVPDWTTKISAADVAPEREDVYSLQMAHFARVIRGEEDPLVPGREGQKTLAATLAVFEAAQTGRTVQL